MAEQRTLGGQPRIGETETLLETILDGLPGRPGSVTRKNYLSTLRVYLRWCSDEGYDALTATADTAQAYLEHLKDHATPSTMHNHSTRIRTLYDLLMTLGDHPGPNPMTGLKLPGNKPEEHRDLYSEEELTRLLTHAAVQERLLILLGAWVGLTGPETVELHWEQVNTTEGHLLVRGRQLQADEDVYRALRLYGAERGHTDLFQASGPLFEFQTDHQLRRALYILCQQANVPYRAWRALRNAAGLRILRESGNPALVAEKLGLSTLKAVQVWEKLDV